MISIIGVRINSTDYSRVTKSVFEWALRHESRYVCAANVHMLMEAHDSPSYSQLINSADLIVPDGMPLVWFMHLKKIKKQGRIYGPTLMLHVLEAAAGKRIPVGFYGGRSGVLDVLISRMKERFIGLEIAYSFSPPFRELTDEEDKEIINDIRCSGARILFVGLGCPKQEIWMAEHHSKMNVVMLGVGAAFDFHAGAKPQSPAWLQRFGLEWLFRLFTEPQRLWRRYIYNNPRFILLAGFDLLKYWFKV